jgi:Rieske Fe-S protein
MDREQFIKNLSLGLVSICGAASIASCTKTTQKPASGGNNLTVDLTSKLLNVGDQLVINSSVLVFRIASGNSASSFVATEAICPHLGGSLSWVQSKSYILCNLHASEYTDTGSVIQGPQNITGTTRALKIYSALITGNNLIITVA